MEIDSLAHPRTYREQPIEPQMDNGEPSDGCPANLSDLPAQQARVYVYDWLKHGAPSAEDFKRAREKAEQAQTATAA